MNGLPPAEDAIATLISNHIHTSDSKWLISVLETDTYDL